MANLGNKRITSCISRRIITHPPFIIILRYLVDLCLWNSSWVSGSTFQVSPASCSSSKKICNVLMWTQIKLSHEDLFYWNPNLFGFSMSRCGIRAISTGFAHTQGLYSLSSKTSYRQISWSLEAARLGVIIIATLWNLAGISAALRPRCLSNFKAIGKV